MVTHKIVLSLLLFPFVLWANPNTTLTVLAAASLSKVLPEVAKVWKEKEAGEVHFSFDGSSRLAKQIEEGAPADLFFSADTEWMDYLIEKNKIDSTFRRNLLGNELVAILPSDSNVQLKEPKDFLSDQIKKIALAGENVPVSKYARAAFEKSNVWEQIQKKVVRGDNVRHALRWTAEKATDAGVVYRTDALNETKVKLAFVFSSASHSAIVYPAAVVKNTSNLHAAKKFLEFCSSVEAQALFLKAGFNLLEKDNVLPRSE